MTGFSSRILFFTVSLLGFACHSQAQTIDARILACDRFATRADHQITGGIRGVYLSDLDAPAAKAACEPAYAAFPKIARLAYQLGRAEHKLGNADRAKALYQEASEKGYLLANVTLAALYLDNASNERDPRQVLDLLQKAADAKIGSALRALAIMHHTGNRMEKNEALALQYYDKAIAEGDAVARFGKASLLLDRYVAGDDPQPIVSAYLDAARHNNPEAHTVLGRLYRDGGLGLPLDPYAAIGNFERAAGLGDPAGALDLARMMAAIWRDDLGKLQRAVDLLREVAGRNDPVLSADAMAVLGEIGLSISIAVGTPEALIERAMMINSGSAHVQAAYALLLKTRGDMKGADAALDKAIAMLPRWAPNYAKRAVLQEAMGNKDLARELQAKAEAAPEGRYFLLAPVPEAEMAE